MSFSTWNLDPAAILQAMLQGVPADPAGQFEPVIRGGGSKPTAVGIAGNHGQYLEFEPTSYCLVLKDTANDTGGSFNKRLPTVCTEAALLDLVRGLTGAYLRDSPAHCKSRRFAAHDLPGAAAHLHALLLLKPDRVSGPFSPHSPIHFVNVYMRGKADKGHRDPVSMSCCMRRPAAETFLRDIQSRLSRQSPPADTSPATTFTTTA